MSESINRDYSAQEQEGINLLEIFAIVKKYLWLIISIVIVFTVCGYVYTNFQKPIYTAYEKVIFTCENDEKIGVNGSSANTTTNNFNTMVAYIDTIIDFVDEGVVLDRAEFYYNDFCNARDIDKSVRNVDEYIQLFDISTDKYNPEELDKTTNVEYIKSNVKISSSGSSDFTFRISYSDPVQQDAKDKVKLLVYAFKIECGVTETNTSDGKYFADFKVYVNNLSPNGDGVSTNISKRKNILIFFTIGVVVAGLSVVCITLFDNTVKSKEEAERLTGANLFAKVSNKE